MFETLFKYRHVVARHREAPFAIERESFLAYRVRDGTEPSTLRKFAREFLAVVRELDLSHDRQVAVEAIEAAAVDWAAHAWCAAHPPHAGSR